MPVTKISDDDREIESIHFDDPDGSSFSVTQRHQEIEKIVAYEEIGPSGPMPYLAVFKRGEIYSRVPAYMVHIYYKQVKA